MGVELGVTELSHESPGPAGRLGASHHRTNVLVLAMKQDRLEGRLSGVNAPIRQVVVSVLRTGLLVGLAMLLILGLLPAVLAAETGGP